MKKLSIFLSILLITLVSCRKECGDTIYNGCYECIKEGSFFNQQKIVCDWEGKNQASSEGYDCELANKNEDGCFTICWECYILIDDGKFEHYSTCDEDRLPSDYRPLDYEPTLEEIFGRTYDGYTCEIINDATKPIREILNQD